MLAGALEARMNRRDVFRKHVASHHANGREATTHVQGLRLKAGAVVFTRLLNSRSPVRNPPSVVAEVFQAV